MASLQELEVFLVAAEHTNFSEAARQLHVSQPSVSQTIQNLEKHFGVELFLRFGRTVRLSDAGQTLLPIARELLTASYRLEETMASLQGAVTGKFTIGCSTTSGKYLLPRVIAGFRQQYPQVRIDVEIHGRAGALHLLQEGKIPLAVSSKQIDVADLEYHPCFRDEVVLIVRYDHPWARSRHVYPDDLLDIPMILREENAGTREVLAQGLRAHDLSPDMLNVVMILGNAEAIAMAVAEGIGAAFISRLAAEQGIALGRIVEVEVEEMTLQRDLYMVRNLRFPFARSQAAFWEFLQAKHNTKCRVPSSGTPPESHS